MGTLSWPSEQPCFSEAQLRVLVFLSLFHCWQLKCFTFPNPTAVRFIELWITYTVSHQPRYSDLFSAVSWTRDSEHFYKPFSLKQQRWDSASCFLASHAPPFCIYRLSLTLMMERIRRALKAWARNNTKWG